MSGEYGIGFRIQGGNYYEASANILSPAVSQPYPAAALHTQLLSLPIQPKWVIFGLSAGAEGLEYTSHHPDLTVCKEYVINAGTGDRNARLCQTPTLPKEGPTDNFFQLASWFKANTDIKVIVYMASEGPAKLHHCYNYLKGGEICDDAFDWNGSESPAMETWLTKVVSWAPELAPGLTGVTVSSLKQNAYSTTYNAIPIPPERDLLQKAYAQKVVKYFATEYKDLIDGYWFDHATNQACNRQYILDAIRSVGGHQADVPIAFQHNDKIPLKNNHPGQEDYTGGHPNPLRGTPPIPPYSCLNEDMTNSIEGAYQGAVANANAVNGYFDVSGDKSLGHIFLPTNKDSWNRLLRLPGWGETVMRKDKAVEWMHRVKVAGGAWSWNPPMMSNNANDCEADNVDDKPNPSIGCVVDYEAWGKLDDQHLTFLQETVGRLKNVVDGAESLPATQSCEIATADPTTAPTESPVSGCTNAPSSCWGYDHDGDNDPNDRKLCGVGAYFNNNARCCNVDTFKSFNSCTNQMESAKVACCAQCATQICT